MPAIPPLVPVTASYFFGGCDSYTDPAVLTDNEMVWSMNAACRGGIVQTRPGTRSLVCAPSFNVQGLASFTPTGGVPHQVLACDGAIYVTAPPFRTLRRLPGIQFSNQAQFVAFAVCQQTTSYTDSGELIFLDEPKSVLVMQDGLTRAAFWDGATSRHLNPSPSGSESTVPGLDETPLGLWMCWSNNRLWVSRRNQVFASDIGNPLKFTETQYISEGRAFYLPAECTGIAEIDERTGIVCFTDRTGTLLKSSIQNRELWLDTAQFQETILPDVGCVAPRSIRKQYGLLWWFSSSGLTNLDAAYRQNLSSRLDLQDNEMIASKGYLSPDLSGVCCGTFENYLCCSVPSGDVLNRHTWALDQAPFEGSINSWNGIWTGWRPVEWIRMIVDGQERVFFVSKDYDGAARIWEAFLPDRRDNECPITCFAQMKTHTWGTPEYKRLLRLEVYAREILGDVSVMLAYAGIRGGYHPVGWKEIVATRGQVFGNQTYSATQRITSNRPQSRVILSQNLVVDSNLGNCGVESPRRNEVDTGFSTLVVWSGRFGFTGYRMIAGPESEDFTAGDCEAEETGIKTLTWDGYGSTRHRAVCTPFDTLGATETIVETNPLTAESVSVTKSSTSPISEKDAQNKARAWATFVANHLLGM